ncbi:N-(5'-phosphoribosyl)anthranilate isomerase [Paracoccus sp. S-4012]|uniref:N-(5'-phosphoribosyl)anthranilate isomerase n=1 Tax=Paracoccus sp. S-4012 TaxID=2665648 RepID=UPI00351B12BA
MTRLSDPDGWIDQIFSARAASRGAVIRRNTRWVEREIGRERFIAEVSSRGWHMIESGGQLVVLCNSGGIEIVC